MQRAAEASRAAGIRVLSARGGELERNLGFGIVSQLFAKLVRGSSNLLSGPAAPAAAIFGLSAPAQPSTIRAKERWPRSIASIG